MIEKPLTDAPRLPPGRRVYVVGDVHGHRAKLQAVHDQVRADLVRRPVAHPVLIHLGDLLDRGPESAGCIDLLAAGPPIPGVETHTLMGNHEWMFLTALGGHSDEDRERWLDNGGDRTLASWGLRSSAKPVDWMRTIPPEHLIFLHSLKLTRAEHGYLFVHAGVRPGVPLLRQRDTDLLWIREAFLEWDGVMLPEAPRQVIVHGHTPSDAPALRHNRIGLDTGAGRGGPLTCAALEGDDIGIFQI